MRVEPNTWLNVFMFSGLDMYNIKSQVISKTVYTEPQACLAHISRSYLSSGIMILFVLDINIPRSPVAFSNSTAFQVMNRMVLNS